jgi:hypothetical protein
MVDVDYLLLSLHVTTFVRGTPHHIFPSQKMTFTYQMNVVKEQAKAVVAVPLGNGLELHEKPDSPLRGNGVSSSPTPSTLLDE